MFVSHFPLLSLSNVPEFDPGWNRGTAVPVRRPKGQDEKEHVEDVVERGTRY